MIEHAKRAVFVACVAVGATLLALALLDYAAYGRFVFSWVWR